ncbi:lipase family protein [Pontibacter chitinilyticus]|uniref:lipase family protein n=1 Tax=Pontibacter chitinilyticus TaxID=2674989 RepID=UPI00321C1ABB
MIKKLLLLYSLLLTITLAGTSCHKDDVAPTAVTPPTDPGTDPDSPAYAASTLLSEADQHDLKAAASTNEYAAFSKDIKYDVAIYKLVYYTTYQGKQIKASGLVCVPKNMSSPAALVSMQHGTIFSNQEAPSNYSVISDQQLLAATGYITLIPDYIGFQESKAAFHPYFDQQHSALAVIDMIKAAKAFCKDKDFALNDKLFLVGYSEGGYVTLAAQKEIETHPEYGLTVTASAAGAGGYDVPGLLGIVTSGQPYYFPASLAYLLLAYNYTNDWKRPLTEIFQEPYASQLPKLFNGSTDGMAINNQLPIDPQKLFTAAFYNGLKDDGKEQQLKKALAENSLLNWAPQSPTRLYHGDADEIISFQNSKHTYQRFSEQGATQLNFITIPGGTHESSYTPMMQSVVPWFKLF